MKELLSYWYKTTFGGKIKKKMAQQITTVRKILDELNGTGKNSPWIEIPSVYTLSAATVPSYGQVSITSNGIILKAFLNTSTGEIKTYLAKGLDIEEAKNLP